ncbi:MAG: isoprenylcysteine carboxylmethyltransferase family protein [Eubacterium sp.]|nr:isoprenylcysteine carboxylmethyltransferase family protein [Eubacterium sp.]
MPDISDKTSTLTSEKEALLAEIMNTYHPEKTSDNKSENTPESILTKDADKKDSRTDSSNTDPSNTNPSNTDSIKEANIASLDAKKEALNSDKGDESSPKEKMPDSFSGDNNTIVMKKAEPLPKYGKGFILVPIVIVLTIIGIVLGHINPITNGIPSAAWVRYLYIGFGAVILFLGIRLIVDAINVCAINENILMGRLVTTGIYSKTRNPEYVGLIFICTSLLFFSGNTFMYILPIIYYVLLTVIMKKTEEPLLAERFGADYENYMASTNRFAPIPKH